MFKISRFAVLALTDKSSSIHVHQHRKWFLSILTDWWNVDIQVQAIFVHRLIGTLASFWGLVNYDGADIPLQRLVGISEIGEVVIQHRVLQRPSSLDFKSRI